MDSFGQTIFQGIAERNFYNKFEEIDHKFLSVERYKYSKYIL